VNAVDFQFVINILIFIKNSKLVCNTTYLNSLLSFLLSMSLAVLHLFGMFKLRVFFIVNLVRNSVRYIIFYKACFLTYLIGNKKI